MPQKSSKFSLTSYFSPVSSKNGEKRPHSDLPICTPSKRRDVGEKEESISPEQADRMQVKKMEAEAKLLTKRFDAGQIGPSWMKILIHEFRQPYFDKVSVAKWQCIRLARLRLAAADQVAVYSSVACSMLHLLYHCSYLYLGSFCNAPISSVTSNIISISFFQLIKFVRSERSRGTVYPPGTMSFCHCPAPPFSAVAHMHTQQGWQCVAIVGCR